MADLVRKHQNVYAHTQRYNYGPTWFLLLHVFDLIGGTSRHADSHFRLEIVLFLTLVDVGIWAFLHQRFGSVVAGIFFLNPISILITGYHGQFDNLAVLLTLVGATYVKPDNGLSRHKFAGLLLLGLSLATKHIFFAYPLWLAMKEHRWRERIVVVVLPLAVFLLAFVPYWRAGSHGIIEHVFKYRWITNAPLWHVIAPGPLRSLVSPYAVFFVALAGFGWVFRRRSGVDSVLLYSIVLVAFSPAIANQHLAIPVAAIAVFPNIWFGMYTAYGALLVTVSQDGLRSATVAHHLPSWIVAPVMTWPRAYDPVIPLVCAGLMWMFWRDPILATFDHIIPRRIADRRTTTTNLIRSRRADHDAATP